MGISGRIARFFQDSQITPLLALVALLLGLFAVVVTPREEEPQIDVTMANVLIPFPGASAKDVESLVATPAEQVLSQMTGVDHVYSISRSGMAIVTVQFKVGVPRIDALVLLHDTIQSNRDWVSATLGVGEPVIKPKGIDDVPVVTLTLWSSDAAHGAFELERVAQRKGTAIGMGSGLVKWKILPGSGSPAAIRSIRSTTSSAGTRFLFVAGSTTTRKLRGPIPAARSPLRRARRINWATLYTVCPSQRPETRSPRMMLGRWMIAGRPDSSTAHSALCFDSS